MRQLAYLGVAALTAVALLGTSCSSDDNDGGGNTVGGAAGTGGAQGTSTGGKSTTATTGTTKATGGATSTNTTGATGGATGAGGVTGAGGASIGGVTGAGGNTGAGGTAATGGTTVIVPLTEGIVADGNFLQMGDLKGAVWTTADKTDGTASTINQVKDTLCVNGTVAKIPCPTSSTCDYSGVWGVDLGWNLNQTAGVDGGDAGDQNPADVSDVTSITINLDGAPTAKPDLRIQLEVKDADAGTSKYYCSGIKKSPFPQTIDIRSLTTSCWPGAKASEQEPFDPTTMQPVSLAFQVVTETSSSFAYNFCVTELTFNTAADGG